MVDRVDYRIDHVPYLRRLLEYGQVNEHNSVLEAQKGQEHPLHHSTP